MGRLYSKTTADIARINAAMEGALGNRKLAAAALDATSEQLKNALKSTPELRARWCNVDPGKPVTHADTISRNTIKASGQSVPPNVAPVLLSDDAVTKAIAKENNRIKANFRGFTETEQDYALSLQEFTNEQIECTVGMMTACLSRAAVLHSMHTDRIRARVQELNKTSLTPEELEEKKLLLHHYIESIHELKSITDTAIEGSTARAKIDLWRKQHLQQVVPTKAKPGFAPLQAQKNEINIHAANGSTIKVESSEEKKDSEPPKKA